MTTKILYFHIFLIFCGWEACVTRSEHLRGAKDKVKRPKGGLTRSWGPYIPNFFNFHPTLTANNSGSKPSKLKNYHIFGIPPTSAFSWYTPLRSYIWNSPLNQPSKFKKKWQLQGQKIPPPQIPPYGGNLSIWLFGIDPCIFFLTLRADLEDYFKCMT